MSRSAGRQSGFSLVEMMLGLALMVVVSLALGGATVVGYRTFTAEARQIAAGNAVSGASLSLVRDLSSATAFTIGTITRNNGVLTVTYGSAPATVVTYRIDAAKNNVDAFQGPQRAHPQFAVEDHQIGAFHQRKTQQRSEIRLIEGGLGVDARA